MKKKQRRSFHYLLIMLGIPILLSLFFTLPTNAAIPEYNIAAGYSTNQNSPMIDSVQIGPSSDGIDGHYNITVYITPNQIHTMTNGGKLYNYYSVSEFLPSYNPETDQYGSFYAKDGTDGNNRYYFLFENLNYTGSNGIFAFKVQDNLGKVFGPFTYKFDITPPTSSEPNNNWNTDYTPPATGTPDTTSSKFEAASLKPHLLVENYNFGNGQVIAGQEFDLSFTLKNYSKNRAVKNIIVKITPGSGVYLKSDTNTFYYENIDPGKSITQGVKCKLDLTSKEDVQNITIETTFEYYDKKESDPVAGGDSIILSVPTGKINRAKITSVAIPKEFKQEKEANVEYSFINNGFSSIYNAETFVYDESGTELYWGFVGNVESGSKATTEKIPLTFTNPGDQKLKLVVQYEDENLSVKTLEKEFVVPVKSTASSDSGGYMGDMPIMDGDMYGTDMGDLDPSMGGEEPANGFTLSPILIGVIAVIILFVILIIIRKIMKKKKLNYDDFAEVFSSTTKENIDDGDTPLLNSSSDSHAKEE